VRIATYNFLHGGSARRNGHLAAVLAATNADIVLCQEARPSLQLELDSVDVAPGDTWFWHPIAGRKWGSAILLRQRSAVEVRVLGFEGWVIGAEIALPHRTCVLSVHCPARPGGYVRAMHRLLDAIAPLTRTCDLVLGGDFNVAAGYRAADEGVRISRGEEQLLDRLTTEFALIPCWQTVNPGAPLAQTLRWTANRTAPYHCDGIFIPRSWRRYLGQCHVLNGPGWDFLSDHNPVVADLDLRSMHHDRPATAKNHSGRKSRRATRPRS
jgi:endonuclease/exonuclease/phosphatase family metal-dependent hydrolase